MGRSRRRKERSFKKKLDSSQVYHNQRRIETLEENLVDVNRRLRRAEESILPSVNGRYRTIREELNKIRQDFANDVIYIQACLDDMHGDLLSLDSYSLPLESYDSDEVYQSDYAEHRPRR